MALPARTSRLTDAVFRAFGEASTVTLTPDAGGESSQVRAILRRPTETMSLFDGEVPTTQPFVRVPHADAPALRRSDVLDGIDGRKWKLAEAPIRPGDGRTWVARVEDGGAAT